MSTPIIFDVQGADIRFGATDAGTPYAVAADFAKTMGYRDAANALRILDEDEKGTQLVSTPGGPQQMKVIYEDGVWELIFRSTLDGAKAIKKQVKEILRTIRETGSYSVQPAAAALPQDYEEALVALLGKVRENKALTTKVAELEPAAESWQVLAAADGDFSVADAAKILTRAGIEVGRDRLFGILHELDWAYVQRADHRYRAMQYAVERRWLSELPQTYTHPRTKVTTLAAPQVRVTVKGLHELHRRFGGTRQLQIGGAS